MVARRLDGISASLCGNLFISIFLCEFNSVDREGKAKIFVKLPPVEEEHAPQIGILEKFATGLMRLFFPATSLTDLIQLAVTPKQYAILIAPYRNTKRKST